MKTLGSLLQAHLDGETTTMARLVKITRQDGTVLGLSNHDRDLTVDGVSYRAREGMTPAVLTQISTLKTNDFEIEGVLDSASLLEEDLRAGLYDNAKIEVFLMNWAAPEQGAVKLRQGWLGEVKWVGGRFEASLRGMADLLQRRVGDIYTPECRHDFGDSKCCIALAALTVSGSVAQTLDATSFLDNSRGEETGYFDGGMLTWTSGANAGQSVEIKSWDMNTMTLTLWLPMERGIALGDTYQATPGCGKSFATCRDRFSNAVNFGGFPHLPGLAKILAYPDSH